MLARIWNLVVKEFIQLRRDRLLTFFIVSIPLVQLILFARSTGRGFNHLPMAVLDLDGSQLSRRLITVLDNTQELDARYYPRNQAEVRYLLDGDRADLAVIIPAGFARELDAPHSSPQIQIIADGSNNIIGSTALSAAQGVIEDFARDLASRYGAGTADSIDLRPSIRFNSTLNTRHYTLPALMGFLISQITLVVASLAFARERELGTLEQLMVTPLRRLELITGKAVLALIIGTVNFLLLLTLTVVGFEVPLKGSPLLLSALALLFILAEIGWGVMISTISHTQQQAVLFVFLLTMIDMTFSGYLVPVSNMPWLLRMLSVFVPLRYYLTIIRGIMIKGATLGALWPEIGALAFLSLGILTLGLLSLNKWLD